MTVTPYHLKLKKVSAKQQRLIDALYEYLPATGARDLVGLGIREAFTRHVGGDISFTLEALHLEDYTTFLSKLPDPVLLVIFGLAPLKNKALCEIDLPVALLAIENMLGGHHETMTEVRTLSDTEQGVLQYLLLQILAHVHRLCGKDARVHFRFEKFAFQQHQVRDLARGDDNVAVLVYRVAIGRHNGFVRLVLPNPFVEEGFLNVGAAGLPRPAESAHWFAQFARFHYITCPIWAEAGGATLTPPEVTRLEEGDMILFDQSGVTLSGGRPSGRALLRIGNGLHGGYDTELSVDDKKVHCKIVGAG